jgi:pyruvate/2-oxoglutarate dehydrogenase complex dihydrolipoamide dehydrogenase (E3) component
MRYTRAFPAKAGATLVEKGETQGFLKIHVEADTRRILSAALLGTGADEAVHSLIDAVYARTPYTEFQRHVRIHPNVSELLPTVLENLQPLAPVGER